MHTLARGRGTLLSLLLYSCWKNTLARHGESTCVSSILMELPYKQIQLAPDPQASSCAITCPYKSCLRMGFLLVVFMGALLDE